MIATLILTSFHLVALYVQTAQDQASGGAGEDPAGTVAFFALYLVPSALVNGGLIGLAAFAVARLLQRGRRVSQRVMTPLVGLTATVVALGLMLVPLIGMATRGLLQLGSGIVALLSGEPGSGPANLIAAVALALLLYVGAFTVGARLLFHTDVTTSTRAIRRKTERGSDVQDVSFMATLAFSVGLAGFLLTGLWCAARYLIGDRANGALFVLAGLVDLLALAFGLLAIGAGSGTAGWVGLRRGAFALLPAVMLLFSGLIVFVAALIFQPAT